MRGVLVGTGSGLGGGRWRREGVATSQTTLKVHFTWIKAWSPPGPHEPPLGFSSPAAPPSVPSPPAKHTLATLAFLLPCAYSPAPSRGSGCVGISAHTPSPCSMEHPVPCCSLHKVDPQTKCYRIHLLADLFLYTASLGFNHPHFQVEGSAPQTPAGRQLPTRAAEQGC